MKINGSVSIGSVLLGARQLNKFGMVGFMLIMAYSQSGFALTEADLTFKAPACEGKPKNIPQEVKTEPTFGASMRAMNILDLDADGQCDIVAFSQKTMDDEEEQVFTFFLKRNKKFVFDSYDMAGRTVNITPVYLKIGGPPFLVIHRTQSRSSPQNYVVRRWDRKSEKIVSSIFMGFDKLNIEKFNDADATTIMLFYVRGLIEKTTKQLDLGEQPSWLYDEINELAMSMDNDRYPELSTTLTQLTEKMMGTSQGTCFLCNTAH